MSPRQCATMGEAEVAASDHSHAPTRLARPIMIACHLSVSYAGRLLWAKQEHLACSSVGDIVVGRPATRCLVGRQAS